jgi:L-ascorbate metabolism protein UlaG (beta-lactamase superfamily)
MLKNIHDRLINISLYTERAVRENRYNWKSKDAPEKSDENRLLFLGTGGNPYNLASQYKQTGGICMFLDGSLLLVDPGPAAIFHAVRNGVDVRGIDAVFISHGHTDHYLDAGTAIEAMTHIMSKRRGKVILPADVLTLGLLSQYHQGKSLVQDGYVGGPAEVLTLSPNQSIPFGRGTITPVPAYHGGDNFGFIYSSPTVQIGYTSDTNYIQSYEQQDGREEPITWQPIENFHSIKQYRKELKDAYADVDVLIANVSYFHIFAHRHITGIGLGHLLTNSNIKTCIITHLDPACYHPVDLTGEIAAYVQDVSGIKTILAKDNVWVQIDELIG